MLIRDAELNGRRCDVRIEGDRITAIGRFSRGTGEDTLEADGGALLPGLWDHHIHLNATAAALISVRCGPPEVRNARGLAEALAAVPGDGWLRGVGYHESVAGAIDRAWLDRYGPARPVRIQHRSGRLWVLNTFAREAVGRGVPADGRLLDGDALLRGALAASPRDLAPVGHLLASRGVIGLTDATARNDGRDLVRYQSAGLSQRLRVMGTTDLDGLGSPAGERKLHYHEHDLPELDALSAEIAAAHNVGRGVAAHCVTQAELVLTLAALEAVGDCAGDRIEHAAVAPPALADWMARLGVLAVTQPHFLAERQDAYRSDVDSDDQPWLYRAGGLASAGVGIAAGSDAPYGGLDPWRSMAAAVERPVGFGPDAPLSPERAFALYSGHGDAPCVERRVEVGAAADLCLLDRSWGAARVALADVNVRATLIGGAIVYASMASISPHSSARRAGSRSMERAR